MTDYKEEQANEVEALEAIYPEEFKLICSDPYHKFEMYMTSQCREDIPDVSCKVQFCFTPTYPDTAPDMEVVSIGGVDEDEEDELTAALVVHLTQQAEENLGMAMIFTLVSATSEWLTETTEQQATDIEQEKLRKIAEHEAIERKKFEGTIVTIETFMAWKTQFDAELEEKKKLKGKEIFDKNKPTGKDLFMLDNTFDDSDVKFLEEEGDSVEVDESLFQDLEDIDIDGDIELNLKT